MDPEQQRLYLLERRIGDLLRIELKLDALLTAIPGAASKYSRLLEDVEKVTDPRD